jgi:hypothetical protein
MASPSTVHFNPSQSPNYGFTIPNAPSPNMRALLAYVDALQAWNFKDVMACFDEALEHRILPQSLGRPVLNKRQYGEYFGAIMPLMKRSQVLRSIYRSSLPFANKFWHFPPHCSGQYRNCPQITIHEIIEAGDKMTVHVRTYWGSSTNNFSIPRIYTSLA